MANDDAREARAAAWLRSHGEEIDDGAALAFHVRASWGLERALARLEEAHLPALVVKGAILAHWLYDSPIERPLRDVDLRVRPADLRRAIRAIAAEPGARVLVESRVYRSAAISMRGVEIDLEATIGPPFVCAVGVAEMLARAVQAVEPLGFRHMRPEIHDHALLLAINAFKDHVIPNASSLEDLARIARRPEFDADLFARRAIEAQCTTLVHVVAQHIAETRRDEHWASIAAAVPPRRRGYAHRVLSTLRGERKAPALVVRLESRAASDGRLRAIAALAAATAREVATAREAWTPPKRT